MFPIQWMLTIYVFLNQPLGHNSSCRNTQTRSDTWMLNSLTLCSRSLSLSALLNSSCGSTLTSILLGSDFFSSDTPEVSWEESDPPILLPLAWESASFSVKSRVPASRALTLHKGKSCSVSWKCDGKPKLSMPALVGPPPGYIWITEPKPEEKNI